MKIQNILFKRSVVMKNVQNSRDLTVKGPLLGIENLQLKSSHSIFYNTPLYGLNSVPLITMIEQKNFEQVMKYQGNT